MVKEWENKVSVQSSDYLVEEDVFACCVFNLCRAHSCSNDGPGGRPVPMKEVNSCSFPFGMSIGVDGGGSWGGLPAVVLVWLDILKRSCGFVFSRHSPADIGDVLFRHDRTPSRPILLDHVTLAESREIPFRRPSIQEETKPRGRPSRIVILLEHDNPLCQKQLLHDVAHTGALRGTPSSILTTGRTLIMYLPDTIYAR